MSKDKIDLLSDDGKAYFTHKWSKAGETVISFGKDSDEILNSHFPKQQELDGDEPCLEQTHALTVG